MSDMSTEEFTAYLNGLFGESATHLEIGQLNCPSGKIVACDPLVFPDSPSFERILPDGVYPVLIAISEQDQRIAGAMLKVSEREVAEWIEAGDYGVDAGTGCFMDTEAAELLLEVMDEMAEDPDFISYYDDIIDKELYAAGKSGPVWTDHHPRPGDELNCIMFESGWGDGMYTCYWGLDDAGEVACLVTDFEVI